MEKIHFEHKINGWFDGKRVKIGKTSTKIPNVKKASIEKKPSKAKAVIRKLTKLEDSPTLKAVSALGKSLERNRIRTESYLMKQVDSLEKFIDKKVSRAKAVPRLVRKQAKAVGRKVVNDVMVMKMAMDEMAGDLINAVERKVESVNQFVDRQINKVKAVPKKLVNKAKDKVKKVLAPVTNTYKRVKDRYNRMVDWKNEKVAQVKRGVRLVKALPKIMTRKAKRSVNKFVDKQINRAKALKDKAVTKTISIAKSLKKPVGFVGKVAKRIISRKIDSLAIPKEQRKHNKLVIKKLTNIERQGVRIETKQDKTLKAIEKLTKQVKDIKLPTAKVETKPQSTTPQPRKDVFSNKAMTASRRR